ncbi:hypothetical protein [Nocardioides sp. P5_E3]
MTTESDLAPRQLATCGPAELERSLDVVLAWSNRESPRTAAAAITEMAANPHLAYEQFVRLLKYALNQWLTWHDVPGGRRLSEAQFQIPATAPGPRAGDWWLRLALHPETVAASETSPLGRLHRSWLMRRAFATNDPEQWPALWRAALGWNHSDVRNELVAFALRRGLQEERPTVVGLTQAEIEGLTRGCLPFTESLDAPVPAMTTHAEATSSFSSALGLDPERAELAGPLGHAVLESAIAGDADVGHRGVPTWMALLTEADRTALLAMPGSCRKEPVEGWIGAQRWRRREAEAYLVALRVFPLDEWSAQRHLTCKAPRHRFAIVLNPTCPAEIALEAIRRGIEETDALVASGNLYETDGYGLIETWWSALMKARGWLPPEQVSAALQVVSGWMLSREQRLHWLWRLAVTASLPDGLDGMTPHQFASYEHWLDELVEHRWTPTDRMYLTAWGASDFGAATSPQMLRRLVHATGAGKSPLLTQRATTAALADLPSELRVQAARKSRDDVLRCLVDDPDKRVRQHVARNGNASGHTLATLAADPDPTVRAQVARNSAITAECLTTLATDPVPKVAQAAGRALLRKLVQVD